MCSPCILYRAIARFNLTRYYEKYLLAVAALLYNRRFILVVHSCTPCLTYIPAFPVPCSENRGPQNRRLQRVRSTASIQSISDNELDHERDVMVTNKLVHDFDGLPSPRSLNGGGAASGLDFSWCSQHSSPEVDAASSGAGAACVGTGDQSPTPTSLAPYDPFSLPMAAGAAGVSPAVVRRRMSQGCRPVSESSNRPHSPLHRVASSSGKAEKAGKHTMSPSRHGSYDLNQRGEIRKTASSSLRPNMSSSSPGRLSIRAPGISHNGKPNPGPLIGGWMLDSVAPGAGAQQSPQPPPFSGFSGAHA